MRPLRFVFLFAALGLMVSVYACNEDASPATPSGPPADVTVTIVANNGSQSYSPNPVTVRAGQTVSWRNALNDTHTATADAGGFNTGNIGPGGTSAPITMSTAGSFAYHCIPHPTMTGTVVVQ